MLYFTVSGANWMTNDPSQCLWVCLVIYLVTHAACGHMGFPTEWKKMGGKHPFAALRGCSVLLAEGQVQKAERRVGDRESARAAGMKFGTASKTRGGVLELRAGVQLKTEAELQLAHDTETEGRLRAEPHAQAKFPLPIRQTRHHRYNP